MIVIISLWNLSFIIVLFYSTIINSLNFESVTVLDPHSDVLEACLNNFKQDIPSKVILTRKAIKSFYKENLFKDEFLTENVMN